MKVIKLYVDNDGDGENVTRLACMLSAWGYKLVRVTCGDEMVTGGCIYDALFKMCVDELEFEVDKSLDEIINDLYYADEIQNINISDMDFVAEVEDGYVYIPSKDVWRIEFDEEISEEEEA
ncbi:MAG: hypothetical protein JHC26_01265 [Thermofilum sp.]|uniref:hypothetical protein n=1 Tax=Thermofilum sp. TaxID=1961369 RepID=UPI00258CBC8A|nr:hypothetical protein [Thermofilum sp.]MCI4407689.1 hypothetical protein [Thermofilum sp.]